MNKSLLNQTLQQVSHRLFHSFISNHKNIRLLGVFAHEQTVYLFFQQISMQGSYFSIARSLNGLEFELIHNNAFIQKEEKKENITYIENFTVTVAPSEFILTYSSYNDGSRRLSTAVSHNLTEWEYQFDLPPALAPGLFIYNNSHTLPYQLYTGNKRQPFIARATLEEFARIPLKTKLETENPLQQARALIATEHEILVVYHQKKQKTTKTSGLYNAGVIAYERKNPKKELRRTAAPVWESPLEWNHQQLTHGGVVNFRYHLVSYWHVAGEAIYAVCYPYPELERTMPIQASPRLSKFFRNPIIAPSKNNGWEAFNTFNPAAVYLEDKVHLIYRAQGFDYISVLGYAVSNDGMTISERYNKPIFSPQQDFEFTQIKPTSTNGQYQSGGGIGGCEDPRITHIDSRLYMTYVAFDGASPPRVALTSITVADFLARRWRWKKPVLISPPNIVDKNACIFPEKINGKYVVMHRIFPDILIDYVDSLEFDGTYWLEGRYKIPHRPDSWDSRKLGAGAPPIKTDKGWLLIYQAVDDRDPGRYKIGAMLLDLTEPHKVLYRCKEPVLYPSERYENEGFKGGVAYPCGAVVINDILYVYYGAADSYVAVATARLSDFLALLTTTGKPHLEPNKLHKVSFMQS